MTTNEPGDEQVHDPARTIPVPEQEVAADAETADPTRVPGPSAEGASPTVDDGTQSSYEAQAEEQSQAETE